MLLAETYPREVQWAPSIGDPDAVSWVIVALYLVASGCCVVCWARRRRLIEPGRAGRYGLFWLMLGTLMLFLGVNKQWDLQIALHEWARNLAIERGLFEARKTLMLVFSVALALIGLGCTAALWLLMRGLWGRVWLSGLGLFVLVLFAIERIVTMLIVKLPLGQPIIGPVRVNHLIEIAGVLLVATGAWSSRRRSKSADHSASRVPA